MVWGNSGVEIEEATMAWEKDGVECRTPPPLARRASRRSQSASPTFDCGLERPNLKKMRWRKAKATATVHVLASVVVASARTSPPCLIRRPSGAKDGAKEFQTKRPPPIKPPPVRPPPIRTDASVVDGSGTNAPASAVPVPFGVSKAHLRPPSIDISFSSDTHMSDTFVEAAHEHHGHPGGTMTEVSPGVFVGSFMAANDTAALAAKGITHMLNCTNKPAKRGSSSPDDVTQLSLGLRDSTADMPSMQTAIVDGVRFIRDALQSGGRVLVYCHQGISRSCTIATAYKMWAQHQSADETFAEIKRVRPQSDPNLFYWFSMKEWEDLVLSRDKDDLLSYNNSSRGTDRDIP
ncbi:hypothetical protein AB1Y20_000700 [Prymnesium parvum]|uniref:Protein-tyrosine-phosphatase n=1 Tax=Prymnesium parvum TaxID=97485 RepID=A0AB34KB59_PRYPA